MKTACTMRDIASREAIKQGPKILTVNGKDYAAYCLTRDQLYKIFANNGFNVDGVAWLNQILRWGIMDEQVPPAHVLKNSKDNDWKVIFSSSLNEDDRSRLQYFAIQNNIERVLG